MTFKTKNKNESKKKTPKKAKKLKKKQKTTASKLPANSAYSLLYNITEYTVCVAANIPTLPPPPPPAPTTYR